MGADVSYERGTPAHNELALRPRAGALGRLPTQLLSEDSAHIGAIGLALEPLAW